MHIPQRRPEREVLPHLSCRYHVTTPLPLKLAPLLRLHVHAPPALPIPSFLVDSGPDLAQTLRLPPLPTLRDAALVLSTGASNARVLLQDVFESRCVSAYQQTMRVLVELWCG